MKGAWGCSLFAPGQGSTCAFTWIPHEKKKNPPLQISVREEEKTYIRSQRAGEMISHPQKVTCHTGVSPPLNIQPPPSLRVLHRQRVIAAGSHVVVTVDPFVGKVIAPLACGGESAFYRCSTQMRVKSKYIFRLITATFFPPNISPRSVIHDRLHSCRLWLLPVCEVAP